MLMSLLTLISQMKRNISEWLARCVWLGEVQAGWGCSVGLPSSRERARWELGKPDFCPYELISVFVFVSALMHFSLYLSLYQLLCISLCIRPLAFHSVFVFVSALVHFYLYCVTRAPLLYFVSSWVALSFKVCQSVRKASVTPVQISTLCNI